MSGCRFRNDIHAKQDVVRENVTSCTPGKDLQPLKYAPRDPLHDLEEELPRFVSGVLIRGRCVQSPAHAI